MGIFCCFFVDKFVKSRCALRVQRVTLPVRGRERGDWGIVSYVLDAGTSKKTDGGYFVVKTAVKFSAFKKGASNLRAKLTFIFNFLNIVDTLPLPVPLGPKFYAFPKPAHFSESANHQRESPKQGFFGWKPAEPTAFIYLFFHVQVIDGWHNLEIIFSLVQQKMQKFLFSC